MHNAFRSNQGFGIAAALLVIAVVSQGIHDVSIEHLGIPYPVMVGSPYWLPVLGAVVRLTCLVLICRAAHVVLDGFKIVHGALIMGLLSACLAETFRSWIIQIVLTHGWLDGRWIYLTVDGFKNAAVPFAKGFAAFLIARRLSSRSFAAAVVIIGTAIAINLALVPAVSLLTATIENAAELTQPSELYQPPYGFGILIVIYGTFLEPTVATYILARMTWQGLPGHGWVRIAAFTALIVGAAGLLTFFFLGSFWVRQPIWLAFLSTGQFFAEKLAMASLVGSLCFRIWSRSISSRQDLLRTIPYTR